MADHETPDHHGSHSSLLSSDELVQSQQVDAIIVPTARRPAYLTAAANLALELDCTLVTLHSKQWTNATKASQRLPRSVDLIAIDVPHPSRLRLPDWRTSRMLAGKVFPRQPTVPRTDLSAKRNLGLTLSRLIGWSRVLFLDDDITELKPDDVLHASGLLDAYNAVGLHICGFHDHSVVCHAYRDAGGEQQSFIGGGALAVQVDSCTSFFPEIYNDDWFFLLDSDNGLQPVTVTGRVVQYPYDPFRSPDRARAEEFGDVLAEGIYWLLDKGLSIGDADRAHWAMYLDVRRNFIELVRTMVQDSSLSAVEKTRRVDALKGSLGRLALITPELCENYLRAWRADQQKWRQHLEQLPAGLDRGPALAHLSRDGAPTLNWMTRRRGGRPAGRYPSVNVPPALRPAVVGTGNGALGTASDPACYPVRTAEPASIGVV